MNKITKLFISLSVLIICSITYPTELYANNDTKYVSNKTINIRDSADPNGEVVGKLKYGDKVVVLDEQYGWSKIKYKKEDAWIASHLLTDQEITTNTINLDFDDLNYKHDNYLTNDERTFSTYQEIKNYYNTLYHNRLVTWLYKSNINEDTEDTEDTQKWLEDYTIILDPGHGGHDPGSTAINGEFEKDLALNLTNNVKKVLEDQGAEVILTRDLDFFVPLSYRTSQVDFHKADAFISIHFNAFTSEKTRGFSAHYYKDEASKTFAEYFNRSLDKLSKIPNRGVFEDDCQVLRETDTLALLLELGFITNSKDLNEIESTSYHTEVGQAITRALASYFAYKELNDL